MQSLNTYSRSITRHWQPAFPAMTLAVLRSSLKYEEATSEYLAQVTLGDGTYGTYGTSYGTYGTQVTVGDGTYGTYGRDGVFSGL